MHPTDLNSWNLSHLVKRARAENVQTFVEGPGHVPIDEVELSVKGMKQLCDLGCSFVFLCEYSCGHGTIRYVVMIDKVKIKVRRLGKGGMGMGKRMIA